MDQQKREKVALVAFASDLLHVINLKAIRYWS